MKSVEELQSEILQIGKIINAPKEYLTIGDNCSDIVVNVELHDNMYHYYIVERGVEQKRIITSSASDIIFLFIEQASHAVASRYAAQNKTSGLDFRELMFQKQLELLRAINPEWAERRKKEIDRILVEYPD
ncbi:Imm63 family immunity protein [Desulfovibrio caledoniensis]